MGFKVQEYYKVANQLTVSAPPTNGFRATGHGFRATQLTVSAPPFCLAKTQSKALA